MHKTRHRLFGLALGLSLAASSPAAPMPPPDRVHGLTTGVWFEVQDSRLRGASPFPLRGGSLKGILAWSGAAYDVSEHRMLVWGGGHSNYAGNEVYGFDVLRGKWTALSRPSEPDNSREPLYPDGQPRSRHTYDYLEFVPSWGRMVSFGGSGPFPRGGGEFTRALSEFDAERGTWVTGKRAPVPEPAGRSGSMIGAHARRDPQSGAIFFVPTRIGSIMRYDPDRDLWQVGPVPNNNVRAHATAAIDPELRQLLIIGGSKGKPQFKRWNIDELSRDENLVGRSSGATEIEAAYGPGFDYHLPSGCLVAWAGGPDLYVLNAATLEWDRLAPEVASPAPPTQPNRTGTYGRFRYDPGLDLFVLVNGVDENVYLYRPKIAEDRCRRR